MQETFKTLILLAHPHRDRSRVHNRLIRAAEEVSDVTVIDLYHEYPDFLINVRREQERVEQHQLLIFQHPIYWYSSPALLKEWLDCVLEQGWAFGKDGTKTKGLDFLQVISSGGPDDAYARQGYNRFTLLELLRPFEATAKLCGWRYHSPFLVQGVYGLEEQSLEAHAMRYQSLLEDYRLKGREVLDALDTSVELEKGYDA